MRRSAQQAQSNPTLMQMTISELCRKLIDFMFDPVRSGEIVYLSKKDIGDPKEKDRKYWIDREIKFSRDLMCEFRYVCQIKDFFGSWLFDQEGDPLIYTEDEISEFPKMKAAILKNVTIEEYRDRIAYYDRILINAVRALIRPGKDLCSENRAGHIALYGEHSKIKQVEQLINSSKMLSNEKYAISVEFDDSLYDQRKDLWPRVESKVLAVAKENYGFFCAFDPKLRIDDDLSIYESADPKAFSRLFPMMVDFTARARLRNQTLLILIGEPVYIQNLKSYFRSCQIPGGKRHFAESTLASAKRTFTEETGIPVESITHSDMSLPFGNSGRIFMVNIRQIYDELVDFKTHFFQKLGDLNP
jgi:hypothetical protein